MELRTILRYNYFQLKLKYIMSHGIPEWILSISDWILMYISIFLFYPAGCFDRKTE